MNNLEEPHSLAKFAGRYCICRKCSFAAKPSGAERNNFACPACGFDDPSSLPFFDLSVCLMADLMHESYCTSKVLSKTPDPFQMAGRAQHAAVAIFFCTIKELLLERFLSASIHWFAMPTSLRERIEKDYDTHSRRLSKLFPALTANKWSDVIASLQSDDINFVALNEFFERVSKERNSLVHDGDHFGMDNTIALDCVNNLIPMLDLFVALNNLFIHPRRESLSMMSK